MVLFFLDRIAPALLRQATYGTIKIGVYHTLKRAVISNPKGKFLFSHYHAFDSFFCCSFSSSTCWWCFISMPGLFTGF